MFSSMVGVLVLLFVVLIGMRLIRAVVLAKKDIQQYGFLSAGFGWLFGGGIIFGVLALIGWVTGTN